MVQQNPRDSLDPAEETICVGPIAIRFLVAGPDSNGSAAVFEATIPAGTGLPAPPHRHKGFEETIYGLDGISTWTVDGTAVDIGPGQALCIRRGAVHAFANYGTQDARVLAVATPGVLGPAYFREAAAVIDDTAGGRPDPVRMAEVMRRHGLAPVPPTPGM